MGGNVAVMDRSDIPTEFRPNNMKRKTAWR